MADDTRNRRDDTTTLQSLAGMAGILGNVLEWYDFGIYGFFSDTIAQVFFPPGDKSLVYSYLVFGGAFLMRPMGGLITGTIGDTSGRKRALVFSLFSMSIPTVAMGFLPSYEQVGGWSTALLVICRLVQGFSVGGQLPSSLVYTLERKPKNQWGFYGSLFALSNSVGSILGNLVGALIRTFLTPEQLVSWGWRVAFFTGILIAPVAAFLHIYGEEHHPNEGEFDNESNGEESSIIASLQESKPLKESLKRENWAALLSGFLTPMLAGAGYYITFVWMAIYMETLLDPPVNGAFWVNLGASLFGAMLPSVFFGWLSDRVGRVKLMVVGACAVAIVGPLMLWVISHGHTVDALFAQMFIGFCQSMFTGPVFAWLPEQFPSKIRLTAGSLTYNMGICLSSGFSPAVATALFHRFGPVAPGAIYPFFSILALIGILVSRRVKKDESSKSRSDAGQKRTTPLDITDDLSAHLL